MAGALSNQMLLEFSEFVANRMGLHFPPERWPDLERGIRLAASEFGAPDAEACIHRLLSTPLARNQTEILASSLTVGETYFFRDKRSFEVLVERALPELIRARKEAGRPLRIWSAGCCTGEEAYSIAISLDRAFPDAGPWRATILGTDVNPRALQKAAEGTYGEWSFRDAPPWLRQDYFRRVGPHRYEILPRIKKMVGFACLNLAEDAYPSLLNNTNAMDLIFCRNVLMYFVPERARNVVRNFHRALVDSGWLFVSATEASSELFSPFFADRSEGSVLYRKMDLPPAESAAPIPHEKRDTRGFEKQPSVSAPILVLPCGHSQGQESISPTPEQEQTAKNERSVWEEGLALFDRGRYGEAIHKLKSGPAQLQAAPEVSALLARACANSGELAEAHTWAEKAISADKLNPTLHYLRAIILQEQGAAEEAVASLKRALYLDPDFVLAHFALGNQKMRQRKRKEAGKHFAHALALLSSYQADTVLPCSDGLVAGRLKELIESTMFAELAA